MLLHFVLVQRYFKTQLQINYWCVKLWMCCNLLSAGSFKKGHTNANTHSHRHMFSQWGAFDQFGNIANTAGRTPTHSHTQTHNVPSSLSREPLSDFHLSFFFSGLLFLLSFPFSFTPFCFLFSPFWVFSAGRHRKWAQVKDSGWLIYLN